MRDPTGETLHRQPRGALPPTVHARQRDSFGPAHQYACAQHTWAAGPDCPPSGRAFGGRRQAPIPRHHSQRLSPHTNTARARDTRALAAHPRDRQPGRASAHYRTVLAPMRGLAARPTSRRPGEGKRLTPDAPRSNWGTRPPREHVQDSQRSLGSNAGHQPSEEYDAEPTSGSPSRTPPHPQHMHQNEPPQAQESHRRSAHHPLPSSQAQQHRNDGADGPNQNAPPISDPGRGTRGHQCAGTPRQQRGPPPRRTGTRTLTWRWFERPRRAARLQGPHRWRATCKPKHPRSQQVSDRPRLPAPREGRPGEGQRLTPDAPDNGERPDLRRVSYHPRK